MALPSVSDSHGCITLHHHINTFGVNQHCRLQFLKMRTVSPENFLLDEAIVFHCVRMKHEIFHPQGCSLGDSLGFLVIVNDPLHFLFNITGTFLQRNVVLRHLLLDVIGISVPLRCVNLPPRVSTVPPSPMMYVLEGASKLQTEIVKPTLGLMPRHFLQS